MKFGKNLYSDLRFILNVIKSQHLKKMLYIGWLGHRNLGDDALQQAIYKIFESKVIFAESRGFVIRILEKIHFIKFDAIMLGGGTLILRDQYLFDSLNNSSISKIIIFGTGVANPEFWRQFPVKFGDLGSWLELLNKVNYFGIRGPHSKKTLLNLEFKKEIKIIGDPVLYFIREIKGNKIKTKKIGLNVGTAHKENVGDLLWGGDQEAFLKEFTKFVKYLVENMWEIEFFPVYPKDLPIIQKVIIETGSKDKISVFQDYDSVELTLNRMESCSIFIGEKLHSVVLAYCANTPAIMIEYRPKCLDFMASIGMERFNIRTDKFNLEVGINKLSELYENLESVRIQANKNCLKFKKELISEAEKATGLL